MIATLITQLLGALAVASAMMVVLSKHPVRSVLYLVVTFFFISGLYIMMNAQFLAIVNIIVYAGAIMVLFLYVIMLMNLNGDVEPQKSKLLQFAGIISGGTLFLVLLAAFKTTQLTTTPINTTSSIGLISELGQVLFTRFVFPFEISSILFLSAMVGAVVIGKKD